jgi:hypothetical protein
MRRPVCDMQIAEIHAEPPKRNNVCGIELLTPCYQRCYQTERISQTCESVRRLE